MTQTLENRMKRERKPKKLDFTGNRTLVMGVLNVTPDSFSDGGKYTDPEKAVTHAIQMINEGADIIDIGGESSRPGSTPVSLEEELERVIPVIEQLTDKTNIPLSIDTTKSSVAEQALEAGASVINDITALQDDVRMLDIALTHQCPVILMHMQGTPQTMQLNPSYKDVVEDIKEFFIKMTTMVLTAGIVKENIILDPGIGFGKTIEHNLDIIKRLNEFTNLGFPIAVGVSRKSFIGKILDLPVEERVEGSLAATAIAVWNGAKIIRTHDVKETSRVVRMVDAIKKEGIK